MLRPVCIATLLFSGLALAQAPSADANTKLNTAQPRQFDTVSIKPSAPSSNRGAGIQPSGFYTKNSTLYTAVMVAYFPFERQFGMSGSPITGAPDWLGKDRYDITAKFDEQTAQTFKTLTNSQRQEMLRPMLQAMLADRCKLVAHMTMVDAPVYELVVGKHGPKMKETPPDEAPPEHAIPMGDIAMMVPIYPKPAKQQVTFFRTSMADLATELSGFVDRQVIDRTGLAGRYDFGIPKNFPDPADKANGVVADPSPLALWDLSETGLELRPARAPQPMLVIDHIEKPSEN